MTANALPSSANTLVLRTDFNDDAAWTSLCRIVVEPDEEGFCAYVNCVSDRIYSGLTIEELLAAASGGSHSFVFIADSTTFRDPEHSILVVNVLTEPGRTFRAILSQVASIQNNLSIANMDFHEFADRTDTDGVFRGFHDT